MTRFEVAEPSTLACRTCSTNKPISEFYVRENGKRRNECKRCWIRRTVERDRGSSERRCYKTEWARSRPRTKTVKSPAKSRESYLRNLPKYRARQRVRTAVRNGSIVKPEACPRCARPTTPSKMQAHHRDYSKPLEVEWMCSGCHGLQHLKVTQ